ncbi:MAG: class I SAM-dependent methyltransferase, partial [Brachymonas sp.]|nr:class I SAM-dependent methyltransferase [Brachymonas sp.]
MTKQTESIRKTYDQTPYQSRPFPQSAPERLQAIAHIFGVDAPAASTARVLELGCSAGGNLIAVAVRHPKLRAMGVDVSGVQIAYGQQVLQSSGISNAELRQASIEEIDESWGTFDYIICHGVYSWVPEHVCNAILRVCQQRLSSNGVAYISYNTYPGWKSREI